MAVYIETWFNPVWRYIAECLHPTFDSETRGWHMSILRWIRSYLKQGTKCCLDKRTNPCTCHNFLHFFHPILLEGNWRKRCPDRVYRCMYKCIFLYVLEKRSVSCHCVHTNTVGVYHSMHVVILQNFSNDSLVGKRSKFDVSRKKGATGIKGERWPSA